MSDTPSIAPGVLSKGLALQTVLLVGTGLALWVVSGREPAAFIDLNLRGLLQGIAFAAALIAVAWTIFRIFPDLLERTARLQDKMAGLFTAHAGYPLYLFIALCAGVGEEALFRGGLQTILTDHLGAPLAIVLSAAGFALIHLAKPLILAIIFAIGLVFGLVYWWTGSLLAVMIGHALYDVYAVRTLHRELIRLGYFVRD